MKPKSRIIIFYLTLLLLLLSVTVTLGCVEESQENKSKANEQIIKDISNEESYKMIIENKTNSNFIILDVRTPEEFAEGHIEDSINIDFYSETFYSELDKLDKSKSYLIYCRTANRSGQALDIMENLDFSEVYNMLGGIVEWESNGYSIVK
jgi:rhodanese-related sulfurtransferase